MVGDRDDVPKLRFKEDGVDYLLFTDRKPEECPGWQVHPAPEDGSRRLRAKRNKVFFPEGYDWIVYMDARFEPKTKLRMVAEMMVSKAPWAVFVHPWNKTLPAEADECFRARLADAGDVRRWMKKVEGDGFPMKTQLTTTGIAFHLDTPLIRETCDLWWGAITEVAGERDQLSFDYARWKTGLPIHIISDNIRSQNKWFDVKPHASRDPGK